MAPQRKSRGVNKKYAYSNEASPSKGADSAKRSNPRKKKLTDMLGPRWTMEELTRFYDTYRKYGKDWKKVSGVVRNRSPEMVEALYSMNRAYLSLPHGTASAAGLTAMMTDHYSNLAGSGSDQESNEGAGPSRKIQKRPRVKAPPASQSQNLALNNRCMSLLKNGGSKPRSVGKRTPRVPVAFSFENGKGEKYYSPTKQGLKLRANADDDEVAHEIALALTEASQRGGSSQVSRTLYKRGENVMSSPFGHAQRKHSATEMAADEKDLEGSTEADTGDLSRHRPDMKESTATVEQKGRRVGKRKSEVDNNNESHLDDLKEEGSGTEEGPRIRTKSSKFDDYVTDDKIPRSSMQSQRKKSKKIHFERDEDTTFDALLTLADLSLMMPTDHEDEPSAQIKEEDNDHVDESVPSEAMLESKQTEKSRPSEVRMKGYKGISNTEGASKREKGLNSTVSTSVEENQDTQIITKTSRRKPKMQPSKIQQTESHVSESPAIEGGDQRKKLAANSMKPSQSSSPKLTKDSENFCSADLRKEGSDSAQSAVQIPVANQVTVPTKVSRRKMNLKKPEQHKELKNNLPFASLPDRSSNFKEKLSSCLSNQQLRKWCTYEWFYSAIDYPWFAKREFVEYLYHVGLGHVPRLTRVEWGVIRSSLGKPRRFSVQFLKEEKDKLNKYRDSVRNHYTELRQGVREGLPTDLARPLSVGQRVIAIHPKAREIHDGSVLTVDHSRCRIQFDHHDLGVEFVMDTDCMPLNPYENMPALFRRHMVAADKLFENFNELKVDGLAKEYMKLSPLDNLDNNNPASLLKQTKVTTAQTRTGPTDGARYQPTFAQTYAKEADVQAIAGLNRALHKKEAILQELAMMNDDVENQKDGDSTLKDSEPFKKQYAGVLVKLKEANEQVTSTLRCLRERNTYHGTNPLGLPRPITGPSEQTQGSGPHVNEIMDGSISKAQTMVNAAMQALSSLKVGGNTIERIEEAIDYVNDRLPSDDYSSMPLPQALAVPKSTNAPEIEAQIPSELITKCISTLLMIQKCTQRQFPPSDVAQILDSAVTSLHPCSSQNLPVYTEIQKCMGIIKNQILALVPT